MKTQSYDHKKLYRFCKSEYDYKVVDCLVSGTEKSSRKIARATGIKSKSTVLRIIKRLEKEAADHGYSPSYDMEKETPLSHVVKGTSTLYEFDDGGEKRLQWVKTDRKKEELIESCRVALEALKEEVPTHKYKPNKKQTETNINLLNLHVLADYHLSMFAWIEENHDEDWDIEKAEKFLIEWFKVSLALAPDASVGVLLNLGDLLHTDSEKPITPASGNVLDSGCAYQYSVRVAIRVMRQIIDLMLQKYDKVHVISVSGNHDQDGGKWLREVLPVFYEEYPNVTIDQTADYYHVYEFGNVSLFAHHGHLGKFKDLPSVFMNKFREVYGRTKKSYGHSGHLHHTDRKAFGNFIMEQHPTMAPADSYSSSHGYGAGRSAYVITYHSEVGEVNRTNIPAEMIHT